MLLIDKTFEIITEESAENGEVEDAGFSAVNESVSFRELVDMIRNKYFHSSQYPASRTTHVWFTSESEQDYITGEHRSESIHFSRNNPARKAKYWIKAMQLAGIPLSNNCNV